MAAGRTLNAEILFLPSFYSNWYMAKSVVLKCTRSNESRFGEEHVLRIPKLPLKKFVTNPRFGSYLIALFNTLIVR